jgi:hypothetical protein
VRRSQLTRARWLRRINTFRHNQATRRQTIHGSVVLSGNSKVLIITWHNLSKPRTNFGRTVMLPALKFSLNGFKLRDHPLLSCDARDGECSGGELPAEMGETKECEGFWLSLAMVLSVSSGEAPELD